METPGLIGPGQTEMCRNCVKRQEREADINRRIADEVMNMSWPSCVVNGCNGYETLRDLIKIKRGVT